MVEEARVPGENHRPWASNWYALSLAAASRICYIMCYQYIVIATLMHVELSPMYVVPCASAIDLIDLDDRTRCRSF